jgi:hypothetical protein
MSTATNNCLIDFPLDNTVGRSLPAIPKCPKSFVFPHTGNQFERELNPMENFAKDYRSTTEQRKSDESESLHLPLKADE